jgi:hypothetical protein
MIIVCFEVGGFSIPSVVTTTWGAFPLRTGDNSTLCLRLERVVSTPLEQVVHK